MELQDVLRRRRMVRSYLPDPIDRETLERIASAARRAPSAGFSQGQGLIIVTDADLRRAIAAVLDEELYLSKGGSSWISTAPAHFIVTVDEERYHARYREPDKLAESGGEETGWPVPYWYVDAGAAMMLVLLAAIDEGLAAGFAGHPDQEARLGELLGIPAGIVPIGVITVGKPAPRDELALSSSAATKRRRRRDEVVHWQRWGGAPA